MTETARMADVVLPATMFMEHDDVYQGGGHQYIHARAEADRSAGRVPLQPRGDLRRWPSALGAEHPGFDMTRARVDRPDAAEFRLGHARRARSETLDRLPAGLRHRALHQGLRLAGRQIPLQAGLADRAVPHRPVHAGPVDAMPALPDHWDRDRGGRRASIRSGSATSPARSFLNSTFNETPTSLARERRPTVMIHPDDAAALGIADGDEVVLGNTRGEVRLHAKRVRRRAPRRADRGIDLAERRLSGRQGHQHADRRRRDRALWRRGVPRQQGLDQAVRGLIGVRRRSGSRPPSIRTRPSATSRSACG